VKLVRQISVHYCPFLGQNPTQQAHFFGIVLSIESSVMGVWIQIHRNKTLSCIYLSGGTRAQTCDRCLFLYL